MYHQALQVQARRCKSFEINQDHTNASRFWSVMNTCRNNLALVGRILGTYHACKTYHEEQFPGTEQATPSLSSLHPSSVSSIGNFQLTDWYHSTGCAIAGCPEDTVFRLCSAVFSDVSATWQAYSVWRENYFVGTVTGDELAELIQLATGLNSWCLRPLQDDHISCAFCLPGDLSQNDCSVQQWTMYLDSINDTSFLSLSMQCWAIII